eukprot:GILK01008845.1.p1 GENE.GILK01008845.1~~GILK01008845.1.p1  ORF type:complete len:165 (-),score=27.71 GILK01008845.1:117-548(-)
MALFQALSFVTRRAATSPASLRVLSTQNSCVVVRNFSTQPPRWPSQNSNGRENFDTTDTHVPDFVKQAQGVSLSDFQDPSSRQRRPGVQVEVEEGSNVDVEALKGDFKSEDETAREMSDLNRYKRSEELDGGRHIRNRNNKTE